MLINWGLKGLKLLGNYWDFGVEVGVRVCALGGGFW